MSKFDLCRRKLNSLVVEFLLNEPLSEWCSIPETEFKEIIVSQVLLKEVESLPVEPCLIILHDVLELLGH